MSQVVYKHIQTYLINHKEHVMHTRSTRSSHLGQGWLCETTLELLTRVVTYICKSGIFGGEIFGELLSFGN